MKRKYLPFGFVLCIVLLTSLSCNIIFADEQAQKKVRATMDAQETLDAREPTQAVLQTTPVRAAMENPDETIVFSYEGENQSYHTGLRNRTVFYINYETGMVVANEEGSFEEPAGTQIRRGTDAVRFNGTYDKAGQSLSGEITIYTQGTATGGESESNTVTYAMTGQLNAQFVDGQWIGTVTGTAQLSQTWEGGEVADMVTNSNIAWNITSISIEKYP